MKDDIDNYTTYNKRMSASLIDKVFFVDKIPADVAVIVDYGCADGTLIAFIRTFFPDAVLIGYDQDPTMTELARLREGNQNSEFYSSWDKVQSRINSIQGKKVVVASSIIHEVYSYGTHEDSLKFWNHLYSLKSGFDYICIRDMMVSMAVDRPSDINDVVKVLRKYHRTKALLDFQANWGSIESNKNLVHFLLKYRYMEPNWEREVKENYLPLYREDFLAMIPDEYGILFHEHYALPYLKQAVKADMGVILKDPTHIKIILAKG